MSCRATGDRSDDDAGDGGVPKAGRMIEMRTGVVGNSLAPPVFSLSCVCICAHLVGGCLRRICLGIYGASTAADFCFAGAGTWGKMADVCDVVLRCEGREGPGENVLTSITMDRSGALAVAQSLPKTSAVFRFSCRWGCA